MVTGGTGFLGRRIVTKLEAAGARPVALGSRDYDLTQPDRVAAALTDINPRYVIHAAAVVGGIGNIRGAMFGGILIGIVETMTVPLLGDEWRSVSAMVVLILVLMFRPMGILGERVGRAA